MKENDEPEIKDNNEFINTKILINILCFQEFIYQRIKKPQKENGYLQIMKEGFIFIKKKFMKKYKDIFDYKELANIIKKKNYELLNPIKDNNNIINYDKLNDSILLNIINKLPEKRINKIEEMNKDKLLEELKEEKEKKSWIKNYINMQKKGFIQLALIDDFEIINLNILKLINDNQILLNDFLYGNCILGDNYIFILIKDINFYIYEICIFENNEDLKTKYLFNMDINDSDLITKYLGKTGIKNFINAFKENEKIKTVEQNNKKITCYKIDININKIYDYNNISELSDKIKVLILLSISQIKFNENHNFFDKNNKNAILEDVILIKKDYLVNYNYIKITDLINRNQKLKDNIDNIDINNLSFKDIEKFFSEIDIKILKEINKAILDINKFPHNYKVETIKLLKSKNIPIYNDYLFINKNLFFDLFINEFKIDFDINEHFSFLSINNKDILKYCNKNDNLIFIGNIEIDIKPKTKFYDIEYILDFFDKQKLDNELQDLLKFGFNYFLEYKLLFNKEDDYISPIFNEKEIVGYCYKYNNDIKDYTNIPNCI